ncbi:MAG: hypothetical protein HY077_10690 [Elusimicrobia bacterium]|nr:hypothetical protein [Elusimicrobiota bacterium]
MNRMPRAAVALSLLSGAAGLASEVLWAKQLAVLIGGTALAQTIVLAAFLGGLSAGSAFFGRRADGSRAPWRFYAALEFGIAALAALAPLFLRAADRADARWLASLAAAAPAFLMGGTLPALCRAAGGEAARSVSLLYGANSAGAVIGSLLTAFILIPAFGLDGAFYAAALVNAAVGLGALAQAGPPSRPASPVARGENRGLLPVAPGLIYGAVFLSGLVALTYEVAWTRLLALVMGGTAYSFCEMLAGFIAGIALGSLLVRATLLRRVRPEILLGLAILGAGGSVLLTLPVCGRLTYYFMGLRSIFSHGAASFYAFELAKFCFCLDLMLVPAACLGAALPLAVGLLEPDDAKLGSGVGAVFAANTAGNVLGAFAGYWCLPWLGLQGLVGSGAAVQLAVGAALLWRALHWPLRRKLGAASAALVIAAGYGLWMPSWDLRILSLGLYRNGRLQPPPSFAEFLARSSKTARSFYRDDREATVSVLGFPDVGATLKVNGKTDASTGEDMRTQILLGELPLLLKPQSRRALLVGWGSGITAGSLLRHPLERLDAVELIPSVVDASRFFRAENENALDDRRTFLTLEDAKIFLRREGPGYDVIINEPSNPWMAGVGGLFSLEYYRRARARLAPGGLMVQWFQVYEMDDELFAAALRTYLAVFPHVSLWNIVDADVLLVGSMEPLRPDYKAMERAFLAPEVRGDLRRCGITALSTLLSLQSASEATVRAMAGSGPLNEDRRPLLEYGAPRAFFEDSRAGVVDEADDRADPASARSLLLAAYLGERGRPLEKREFMERMVFPRGGFEKKFLKELAQEWHSRYPRAAAVRANGSRGRRGNDGRLPTSR